VVEQPQQPHPSSAERAARWAVFAFLGLATLVLAFGLGFAVKDLTTDSTAAASGAPTARPTPPAGGSGSVGAAVIDEIVEILRSQYVDRKVIDEQALKEAAISGIIASLNDRETHYLSPNDLQRGTLQMESTYEGIGASVSDRNGVVTIVAPFRDSPAEAAGIRAGDVILEVDGERTDGWTSAQAVERIRGPRGTKVTLTVQHTDGTIETIEIVRGDINIESVFREPNLEVIPGESGKALVDRSGAVVNDICYLAISQFHDRTLAELRQKAADIEAGRCVGLILDLRSNPGGGLQSTKDVADEFLDKGTIIIEVDADGRERASQARSGGILTRIPIVVLQDGGSASGAEVLAAAIRDNGRGIIIGSQSFGKGTVNRLVPLTSCGQPNCGAVYLAIGRWLTPKGELIEGLGIVPDILLPMTADDYIEHGDIQVFEAIEYLRKGR
jgi:carboxyl-terminal processing protease